jgi:hypothetical protein
MRMASRSRSGPSASALAVYSGVSKLDLDVALRGEVVDFGRLRFLNDTNEIGRVSHVAIVQCEADILFVRIVIEMVDALRIKGRGAAFDAVDHIAFAEQEFGKIGAVLAGGAGDESDFV